MSSSEAEAWWGFLFFFCSEEGGGQEDHRLVHYRDTVENIGVPWQLTYIDQMLCRGILSVLQLEQVFVSVCVCVRVCVFAQGYNFDTHRCLDNLSTVHPHL